MLACTWKWLLERHISLYKRTSHYHRAELSHQHQSMAGKNEAVGLEQFFLYHVRQSNQSPRPENTIMTASVQG